VIAFFTAASAFCERQIAPPYAGDKGKSVRLSVPDAQPPGSSAPMRSRETSHVHFERYLATLGFIRMLSTDRRAGTRRGRVKLQEGWESRQFTRLSVETPTPPPTAASRIPDHKEQS
jgi:hypothetical protein